MYLVFLCDSEYSLCAQNLQLRDYLSFKKKRLIIQTLRQSVLIVVYNYNFGIFVQVSITTRTYVEFEFHYENTPIQIFRKFHLQKLKNADKNFYIFFSYFCPKHRLWILVRTASERRF